MNPTRTTALIAVISLSTTLNAMPGIIKAAIQGDLEKIKTKIAAGKNVNEVDKFGWTPLMWSVYYQQIAVTLYLLDHGADPNIQTSAYNESFHQGATALIIASYFGMEIETGVLVASKAKVDLSDSINRTAANYAREQEHTNILNILDNRPSNDVLNFLKKTDNTHLESNYTTVVIEKFIVGQKLTSGPNLDVVKKLVLGQKPTDECKIAVDKCQEFCQAVLIQDHGFEKVEVAEKGKTYDASTIIVMVEIEDFFITSSFSRWAIGNRGGRSWMHAKVKLVNGATGKVEREEFVASEKTIYRDLGDSISQDTGAIIGHYVRDVAGKK